MDELDPFLVALEKALPGSSIRIGIAWLEENGARVAVSAAESELEDDARGVLRKAVLRMRREGDQPLEPGGDISRGSFGRMKLEVATNSGLLHGGLKAALTRLVEFGTADPIRLAAVNEELPSFYVFVCQTPDERVLLFGRRLNPSNIARRGAIRFVVGDEATLKKFDKELLVVDNKIDWVFVEDEFLVLNTEQLEAALVDPDRLLDRTRANANAINEKIPIENFADFEKRCLEVPGMQTRLARIVSSPEWQAWKPDVDGLRKYSARYGNVVEWGQSGGIKFDGQPRRQWNILKLLDQAFYTGELTQTQYEATGKQSVQS
jgi:Kiwa protein KwaB-like